MDSAVADMQKILSILFILLTVITCSSCSERKYPLLVNGSADLSGWNFQDSGSVPLSGEWQLYWNRLLTPQDIQADPALPPLLTAVPGDWSRKSNLPSFGYATYRAKVRLPDPDALYGIRIPRVMTSYDLWLDGKKILSSGKVSSEHDKQVAARNVLVSSFRPASQEIEIVIQMANFDYRRGGLTDPPVIGLEQQIVLNHTKRVCSDSFAAGAIFIMGLYHIVIFLYRRKNRSALFLGLFSMAMVVRLVVLGETIISLLFPSLPWELILRGDLISVPMGCLFFYFYIKSLCEKEIVPVISYIFITLFVSFSVIYAVLPVARSNYLGIYMPYIFGTGMIYTITCVIRCTFRRREGMPYLILGLLFLFTAGFNDTLHASGIIYTDFIMPYGFVLFFVSQSFLLSDFGARSQKSLELLSSDLTAALEASNVISGEIEVERFLSKMMDIVASNSGADVCAYICVSEKKLTIEASYGYIQPCKAEVRTVSFKDFAFIPENIVTHVLSTGEPLIIDDLSKDPVFSSGLSYRTKEIRAVYCLPIRGNDSIQGILYMENNQRAGAFDSHRLVMTGLLSSQIRISLENARLYDNLELKVQERTATIEQQKTVLVSHHKMMNDEIRMAESIQKSLLPQSLIIPDEAELSYMCMPMLKIGGDFVSVKVSKDKRQMLIFICDVSGHGIAAALLASMISISLDTAWDEGTTSPLALLNELRARIAPKLGKFFFSASACCIDLHSGKCIMASAGHPPALFVRQDGSVSPMRPRGRIIAQRIEPELRESETTLNRGDSIVLYTDGVTEARNAQGSLLGAYPESCSNLIQQMMQTLPFESICGGIVDEVKKFTGRSDFDDDLTILIFRFRG